MSAAATWTALAALGAVGALARFWLGAAVSARRLSALPYGTLAVNLSGTFALGLLTGLGADGGALLILGTGLLGSYTTFSTWMVEAQRLGEDAAWWPMWTYLLGSMAAGLAATGLGWAIGAAA